jgi:hypothetical protein
MQRLQVLSCAALMLIFLTPAFLIAQQGPPGGGTPQSPSLGPGRGEGPACLAKVGVSKSEMEQMKSIHMQTRQRLVSVCENTALSADQKQQQLRQEQQKEKSQIMALFTPQQQALVKQCRPEWRDDNPEHAGGKAGTQGQSDPCPLILQSSQRQHSDRQGGEENK